jgi:hypothetical protein
MYASPPFLSKSMHVYTLGCIQNLLVDIYAHLAISLPKHFKHPHSSAASSVVLLSHSTIKAPGPSLTAAARAKANVNENLTHSHGECLLNIGASSLLCFSVLMPCELFLF